VILGAECVGSGRVDYKVACAQEEVAISEVVYYMVASYS
jgi:hypothetical protein